MFNYDNSIFSPISNEYLGDKGLFLLENEKQQVVYEPGFKDLSEENDDFLLGLESFISPAGNNEDNSEKDFEINALDFPEVIRGELSDASLLAPESGLVETEKRPKKTSAPRIEKNVDFRLKDSKDSRSWECKDCTADFEDLDVLISMKNRTEKAVSNVPDIMYSSIQYQFPIEVKEFCEPSDFPFLLSKIFVLDAETEKKLTHDLSNKAPIRGTTDAAITRASTDRMILKGMLKIKLGDLTYFKSQKNYMLQIEFYLPEALDTPVMSYRTPVIRIYARKPNKKKRKRETVASAHHSSSSSMEPCQKKRKLNAEEHKQPEGTMSIFSRKLSELTLCLEKLGKEERKSALEMITREMFSDLSVNRPF